MFCASAPGKQDGNRYCSRICCATALKQALELKERFPQARIRVYYRDIRTVRREWEELYNRAREAGILFLRGAGAGDTSGGRQTAPRRGQ